MDKPKYALPPGFVEPPAQARQIIEYLGFDPLLELADSLHTIPDTDYRARIQVLNMLVDRTHPRKTDRVSEEGAPVAINIGIMRDPVEVSAIIEHADDDEDAA